MFIENEKMIKEYCPHAKKAVIRTTMYGSDFERFICFVNQARSDFPTKRLEFSEFEIVKYGGDRYAKTFGIEFMVANVELPEDYVIIEQLEYTS